MKDKRKLLNLLGLILLLVGLLILIVVIILGYTSNLNWTGLNAYTPPHPYESEFQRGKTLWDWMQLLIIPIVLAIAGYLFNSTTSRTEQNITKDNQRETALQQYIDKMSELLLHEDLRKSGPEKEVRKIARVRTLTVLSSLDKGRKRSVLQFLYESGLIDADDTLLDLNDADMENTFLVAMNLREANLSGVDFYKAILAGANLSNADLSNTNFREADLSFTNLSEAFMGKANLTGTNLTMANLSGVFLGEGLLTDADLSRCKLNKTELSMADLSYAKLIETDLTESRLILANLSYAKLNNAKLTRADLSCANFDNTDLSEADLSEADLSEADLRLANLDGANLSGAKLNNALVFTEQLDKAKSLLHTIMTDGSIHP